MAMIMEIRKRCYNYNIGNYSYQLYQQFNDVYDVTLGCAVIETVVTRDPREVEVWLSNTLCANNCRLSRLLVGLDVEWTPQFYSNYEPRVAILQLSVGKDCLIYQICHSSASIPSALSNFLSDPRFTFVGVGIDDDVNKLWRDYNLIVSRTKDLRSWAGVELQREELSQAGLKKLVKEVIGEDMDKPKNVTLSKWDNYCLNEGQVLYACGDAY